MEWVFNIWLAMMFYASPGNVYYQAMYEGLVAQGATCYVLVALPFAGPGDPGPPPPCPYLDPLRPAAAPKTGQAKHGK